MILLRQDYSISCFLLSLSSSEVHTWAGSHCVLAHFHPCTPVTSASVFFFYPLFSSALLSSFIPSFSPKSPPFLSVSLLSNPLLSFYLSITFHLLPSRTSSASKGTRGSSWMATGFSFPLMLSSHSAVACVRAERTPGSPPEASARRSPPLPAHLREPSEWSAIVLAVIWWPHSTGRQSQEPGGSPTSLAVLRLSWFFFFSFLLNMSIAQEMNSANTDRCMKALHIFRAFKGNS